MLLVYTCITQGICTRNPWSTKTYLSRTWRFRAFLLLCDWGKISLSISHRVITYISACSLLVRSFDRSFTVFGKGKHKVTCVRLHRMAPRKPHMKMVIRQYIFVTHTSCDATHRTLFHIIGGSSRECGVRWKNWKKKKTETNERKNCFDRKSLLATATADGFFFSSVRFIFCTFLACCTVAFRMQRHF